tara:strand:- start:1264 stop:2922 length:1659 start_codon:yes stop_codon:yes gene_type:complete
MNFNDLSLKLDEISQNSSLLRKVDIISELLSNSHEKDITNIIYILQGKFAPEYEKIKLGISNKLILKSLSKVSGIDMGIIEKMWADVGDIGQLSYDIIKSKKQNNLFNDKLMTSELIEQLNKMSKLEGKGSTEEKIKILIKLYSKSEANSVKYITRMCIQDMRIGAGFGVIRDSISKSFNIEKKIIQSSYDIYPDIANIAHLIKKNGINFSKNIKMSPGKPIKVMLFQKAKDVESSFEKLGKELSAEYKYDGFRLQIHRNNDEIKLFTRNLEEVSKQFPDIISIVKSNIKSKNFIIDCEAIGINRKNGSWMPFQKVSRRIKRKYDIDKIINEIPISLRVFDIIYENNNLINTKFYERRKILENIVKHKKDYIELSELIITNSSDELNKFYKKSLKDGAEGIMLKNLSGIYKPGSRVGFGLKMKPTMENLDLVITGAEWGTGKRANWLSSFELSCKNKDNFLTIGKMGTGIKEKDEEGVSFGHLTKLLTKFIISESGKTVKLKPGIIVEVAYEELQKSENYNSGYALRFPRFVRLREDLSLDDVDDLTKIKSL